MKNIMKSLVPVLLLIIVASFASCEFENIECPAGTGETYQSLDSIDLIEQVENYRENIWKRTSPYYESTMTATYKKTEESQLEIVAPRALHDQSNLTIVNNKQNFDARFADFSRAELEDYLCTIRNLPNADSINTIRIYYTRYGDNPSIDSSFANKHSLALIPVIVDEDHETIREILNNGESGSNYKSYIMNHGWVCPPKKGWINSNTILGAVDMQP